MADPADTPAPRVSILIPNFNNGRRSSRDGTRDFIGDLFKSLWEMLHDDPTPFEVLVADDGSTDDSLDSCRAWSRRTWSNGRPFLRLIERAHCGVLSRVLNGLMRAARGELFFRLDGDIVVHTRRWVSALCRVFDESPEDVGIVGPKQLGLNGRIHACGDWILHPRGFHHPFQGAPRDAAPESFEVDDIMGCFHCMRRVVWETVGDYDESILRGQTNDYSLRARLHGWRLMYTPAVEFTHAHAERAPRANVADTEGGLDHALDRVRAKWGFDRLAPDLAEVKARWAGTPLLWNSRVWTAADAPRRLEPPPLEDSPWLALMNDGPERRALDRHMSIITQAIGHAERTLGGPPRVVSFGADAGLLAHVLAHAWPPSPDKDITSLQHHPGDAALGTSIIRRTSMPGRLPRIVAVSPDDQWPVETGAADLVLLVDCLEWHWNPVGLLKSAHRVLAPNGFLLIRTPWRGAIDDHGSPNEHRYRAHELNLQLRHSRLFEPVVAATEPPPDGWLTTLQQRATTAVSHGHFGERRVAVDA